MKRDPVVIIVVAMVVTLLLVFGIQKSHHSSDQVDSPGADLRGKIAPEFSLPSLDGKTIHLSDFRGRPVLLNFWATWCEPCKIEMPWFVDFQKQYASQGLQVLGVAMDDASPSDIKKFATEMGVNYPIVIGKDTVGDTYGGVQFLPATFYIARDGKVIDRVFGIKGRGEIDDDIKKAIASAPDAKAQK